MSTVSLKRLILKKDIFATLNQLLSAIATPISIEDADRQILLGDPGLDSNTESPIILGEETIGWVLGHAGAAAVAQLLTYLANQELEKKLLARETLDKYKEVSLLYNISEKMSANLELEAVADLVLEEARRLIRATSGSVVLWNSGSQQFQAVATFGQETEFPVAIESGKGIAGSVLATGTGEIVNDVTADPRFIPRPYPISSLICAPLKNKDEVLGVISLSSETVCHYTAADLKLFTALASQAASAIENALLHAHKLREERIKSNLERYVASQVVQAILDAKGDISLNPIRSHLVILFSDIRNFTTQCEELAPEAIVGYLNEYFTHMVEVIFQHNGTVNKFVGDMIVALFGAPSKLVDSEQRAIETAIEMQRRIQQIPTDWIRRNFHTGIGISAGEVIVGNIGSPQHMDYTAIGDEVNIASRLQSIARGGQILVSRAVYDATQPYFEFKACGHLTVKGKRKSVEVFEVIYQ